MANRIWGLEFLSRRGSSTLSDEDAPTQMSKKGSRVQTLCSMRQKPSNSPVNSSGPPAESDSDAAAVTVTRKQADQDRKRMNGKSGKSSPSECVEDLSDSVADGTAGSIAATSSTPAEHQSQHVATYDSASSGVASGSGLYPANGSSDAIATAAAGPSGVNQTHDSSTSLGSGSSDAGTDKEAATVEAALPAEKSEYPLDLPAVQQEGEQQQQQADAASATSGEQQSGGPLGQPRSTTPQSTSAAASGAASSGSLSGGSPAVGAVGAVPGVSSGAAAASPTGSNMADLHALLLGELQREAGLDPEQTARAAALLQRLSGNQSSAPQQQAHPVQQQPNPAWQPAAPPPNPLLIPNNTGFSPGASPAGLNPGAFQGPGAGFNGMGAGGFGMPGLGFGEGMLSPRGMDSSPGMHLSGSGAGLESGQNSTASNLQPVSGSDAAGGATSGSGFAGTVPAGAAGLSGLTSHDAVYGTDGLDVPGTAQVAVHNVPFKWCNADLEALFKQLPGYLDAQLLFHENGRSKGVGVGLFRDVASATEACGRLSGVQADGRKLELVLMSPDNHISFSCKQVAVLGLPWEYTAADVCELIEAAAVADGDPPGEAGVEAVEVAYREDGKSEGRAIATFRTRHQAHNAVARLHGRETLAGLRMRLFYLHEQQQRQHLLAQAPQSLITSVGQLSLDAPSPAAAAVLAFKEQHSGMFAQGDGDSTAVSGTGNAVSGGSGGEEGVLSGRSSFEKDQGPVILHVSGLMESVSREQLRELFSQAGEVTKVDIPDGGRSMGYGFITFSNPQAAEQAMLLFNNYPLGGGAIHVAYSTSATAKARQQALRQARKATLGATGRASMEGRLSGAGDGSSSARLGAKPSTPRGGGIPGGFGTLGSSLPGNRRSFTGAGLSFDGPSSGMGSFEALLGNVGPSRHSFDHPGFTSPGLGLRGNGAAGGMFGAAGPNGSKRSSLTNMGAGLTPVQLQQLQLLQAAGGPAAAAASAALAAGTAAPFDQGPSLEQLLMQVAALDPTTAAAAGLRGGLGGFAPPGTPHGGPFGAPSPVGALGGTGLFGTPGRNSAAASGLFGSQGIPGAGMGAGLGLGGAGGAPGGLFGATAGSGPFGALGPNASLGMPGMPVSSAFGAGMGASTFGSLPGAGMQGGIKSVVVTGMPLGLDESQVIQLFQICGPVQHIHKPADSEVAVVTYDTPAGASRAIQVLDGTNLPSGGTLTVRLAPLPSATDPSGLGAGAAGLGPLSPGAFGNPANMFSAGGLSGGSDRSGADAAPNGWEFVASGVGESNIFAQGSAGAGRGLGLGRGSDMFGFSGAGAGGDGGVAGAGSGKPPAPVYPAGLRQGITRSPSPGAVAAGLAFGANSGGASPAPARQPPVHLASPVPTLNSGELFNRPAGAAGLAGGDGLGLGTGFPSGSVDQSQSLSQSLALGGNSSSGVGLPALDVGGMNAEGSFGVSPHMISPAGDSSAGRLKRDGSWGSLKAQQSAGSGVGSGSDS